MAKDQALIDAIAKRLKQARERRGFTSAAAAAAHFGWAPSTYQGHENGGRGFGRGRLREYATAFRVSMNWLLTGEAEPDTLEVTRAAPVVGEVAAGVWREVDVWDAGKYPEVPVATGRYAALKQRAYMVSGPSMDLAKIFDGDFVVCVEYWMARQAPTDGDIVVVCRRRGPLVERTVKQVAVANGAMRLIPRSSDPRFQEAVTIAADGQTEDGDDAVEITDLVIGVYRSID